MPAEMGDERAARNQRLRDELADITKRLTEIQQELGADLAGEQTPEQRRRGFGLIIGGGAGIAALITTPAAWARKHGKPLAAGLTGAIGGAAITAAVITHPAPAPHAGPQPPPLPGPTPTATTGPGSTPGPVRTRPGSRRGTLPPGIIIPSRRRGGVPSATAAPDTAPAPPPPPSPTPPPTPQRSTPTPSCLILVEAGGILTVCV